MDQFIIYIIKSTLGFSILYLFYWLLLRNETYFRWNRWYLVITIIVSILLPLMEITYSEPMPEGFANLLDPVLVTGSPVILEEFPERSTINVFFLAYIGGVVFFALRFISGLVRIAYIYNRFPRVKADGFKVILLDTDFAPFTFFNLLFISKKDFNNKAVEEMIIHESAHRDDYHSLDILMLELITIIQWFNPLVWALRRSLKSEHEFIADKKVLSAGYNTVDYQRMLFEKSLGISSLVLTNDFNYSLLKKRLKMMSSKSNSYARYKYLMALPILLISLFLLTINVESYAQEDNKIYEKVEVMPEYINGGVKGLMKDVFQNIRYPESARSQGISARIFVEFVVDREGKVTLPKIARNERVERVNKEIVVVGYGNEDVENPKHEKIAKADLEAESIRVVSRLGDFKPGMNEGKPVLVAFTIPIQFILDDGPKKKEEK
jgi:hypothetical protein